MGCSGCGIFGMWDVCDVTCLGYVMFGIRNVQNVGCLEFGMFRIWIIGMIDSGDVES